MNVEIVTNKKALTTVRNKKKELKDLDNHAWESNNETGNNVIEALDSVNELETNLDQSKESISRRLKHEVPFSEISDLELNKAGVYDRYSSDYTAFNVLGMEVQVSDDQLSKALKCLPERKRNIILLSYFMDMSDAEIGELMNVVRTTVYRHRTSTLEELRKMMEEE